jgi:hypothetical protein
MRKTIISSIAMGVVFFIAASAAEQDQSTGGLQP